MTKKSSFLRQLNLYGFNRLSGGSYYHEKYVLVVISHAIVVNEYLSSHSRCSSARFLRGLKMLSTRMQRVKVNGNGIRAAGNPEEEPNLASFPVCPPTHIVRVAGTTVRPEMLHALQNKSFLVGQSLNVTSHIRQTTNVAADAASMSGLLSDGGSSVSSIASVVTDDSRTGLEQQTNAAGKRKASCELSAAANEVVTARKAALSSFPSSVRPPVSRAKSVLYQQETFPLKLQRILDKFESEGKTDVLGKQLAPVIPAPSRSRQMQSTH
jgi:hypothetical protein